MLTRDLALATYDFRTYQVIPDRLTTRTHAGYVKLAERMLQTYRNGIGLCRRQLHQQVRSVFDSEPDCPQRRIDAFCKLLDEASVYCTSGRRTAPQLRRKVFRMAAEWHPLVNQSDRLFDHTVSAVQTRIAAALGRPWSQIQSELYADIIDFHLLEQFPGYETPGRLLSRYNVAQVQAALFSAIAMDIRATTDFKRILRAARLSRLMHTITRVSDGVYDIRLDGPASILRETRRYGVQMAKFLPALISCTGWTMQAGIRISNGRRLTLRLSHTDGLRSHLPADNEFDSTVEADFAAKWGSEPRDGWSLHREAEFLHAGQRTFVPDFVFRHQDGRSVMMEIVGFWTPEYIQSRLQTHALFADVPILLAIHESTQHHFTSATSPERIIPWKTALLVKPVMDVLSKLTA